MNPLSMNKQKIVRAIGQRTRLKNRDVEMMLETLIEVWTEELANGGRIELEGFCTLQVQYLERVHPRTKQMRSFPRLHFRPGKRLQIRLKTSDLKKGF